MSRAENNHQRPLGIQSAVSFLITVCLIFQVEDTRVKGISVSSINPTNQVPPELRPFLNESSRQQTNLYTIMYPQLQNQSQQPVLTASKVCASVFDRIAGERNSKRNIITFENMLQFINETVKEQRQLRNGSVYEMPSDSMLRLSALIQMQLIDITSSNVSNNNNNNNYDHTRYSNYLFISRKQFGDFVNQTLSMPITYYTSICDALKQTLRFCKFRLEYLLRSGHRIGMIQDACYTGLTSLGGWRVETCVMQSLNTADDLQSVQCRRVLQCFTTDNTLDIQTNNGSTSNNNNITGTISFWGNISAEKQAYLIGQRAVAGAYIQQYYKRMYKLNSWVFYFGYTGLGTGLFVLFALIFPVYSLMLGLGGLVANVIFMLCTHYFANWLLGYGDIMKQQALDVMTPDIFAS